MIHEEVIPFAVHRRIEHTAGIISIIKTKRMSFEILFSMLTNVLFCSFVPDVNLSVRCQNGNVKKVTFGWVNSISKDKDHDRVGFNLLGKDQIRTIQRAATPS